MPMGVAWKESTSNGTRPPPPNRRAVAHPCGAVPVMDLEGKVPPLFGTYGYRFSDLTSFLTGMKGGGGVVTSKG